MGKLEHEKDDVCIAQMKNREINLKKSFQNFETRILKQRSLK